MVLKKSFVPVAKFYFLQLLYELELILGGKFKILVGIFGTLLLSSWLFKCESCFQCLVIMLSTSWSIFTLIFAAQSQCFNSEVLMCMFMLIQLSDIGALILKFRIVFTLIVFHDISALKSKAMTHLCLLIVLRTWILMNVLSMLC